MNINQLGQKKKKQAVRRLSQSSPASQGNRKEDIRRKLEARRLVNLGRGGGQSYHRGRGARNVYKSSSNQGYGRHINPFKFQRDNPQRHVSPLANATGESIAALNPDQHDNTKRKTRKKETEFVGSPFANITPVSSDRTIKETATSFEAFIGTTKQPLEQNNNMNANTKDFKPFGSVFTKPTSGNLGQSPLAGLTSFNHPKDTATANVAKTIAVFEQKGEQITSTTKHDNMPFVNPVFTKQSNIFGQKAITTTFTNNNSQSKSDNASLFGQQETQTNTFTNIGQSKSETFDRLQTLNTSISGSSPTFLPGPTKSVFGQQNTPTNTFTNINQRKSETSGTLLPLNTQTTASQTFLPGPTKSVFGQQNTPTKTFTNINKSKSESSGTLLPLNTQASASSPFLQGTNKNVFGQQNAATNALKNITQSNPESSGSLSSSNTQQTAFTQSIFGQQNIARNLSTNINQSKPESFDAFQIPKAQTNGSSQTFLPGKSVFGQRISALQAKSFGSVGDNQSTSQNTIPSFTSQIGPQSTGTFSSSLSPATISNTLQRHVSTSSINTPMIPSTMNQVTTSDDIFGGMVQQQGQIFVGGSGQFIGQQTPSLTKTGVQGTTFGSSVGTPSFQTSKEPEKGLPGKAAKILPKRERRVSTSSVDISQLTAVVIKGLTREYLNKKVLTELLMRFGDIKKVLVQPTKEQAIVTFEDHESAKEAKANAKALLPIENIGIYWYKKSKTSSAGGTNFGPFKELSESNQEELRLRHASIMKALKAIDTSVFPLATTAKDRYNILDEVDIKIRQAIKPYKDLATAPTTVGVCPDMCPEKERYMREDRMNLSIFEIIPGTQDNRDGEVPQVDHIRAVKEYSRSAADKLEPLAHEMRPLHVLQLTMDYLTSNVMDNGSGRLGEWFNFLWDRTRAIRKDITQQHLCNVEVAELVETITRFHIFCAHYLCEEDIHSFDPKINNENLTKCLQTLKQIYEDLYRDKSVVCNNEAEFQAYDILLNLNEGDTLRKAMKYRSEVRNSAEVKFALQVFSSLNSNNYVRFFYLLKSSSYLNACIMHRYFTQVRSDALRTMTKAYRPQEQYPLDNIQNILLFEDKEHAKEFCEFYGFATTPESVQFSKMSFTEPENLFHSRKAENIIETKRGCFIGEVVAGAALKPFNAHVPLSSFDDNGHYIGLNYLCQLLGGDGIPSKEPETPDYYSEHDGSLLISDNQLYDGVQPAVDVVDGGFLMQVFESVVSDIIEEAITTSLHSVCEHVIIEAQFKLKTSQQLTSQFLSKSLSIFLHEIASECLQQETLKQREKLAICESRHRVTGVILGEILKIVIQSELCNIAHITIREMKRRENAQMFLRVSSMIVDDLMQQVVLQQCSEISQESRKQVVKEKKKILWKIAENVYKNKRERYFKKWIKEFRTTLHIKDILVHMPPLPAILTPEQQVQKLFNKSFGNKCHFAITSLGASFKRKSSELEEHLENMMKEQELKRMRTMQPIDVVEAIKYSPNHQDGMIHQNGTKTIKLVLSLHDHDSNSQTTIIEKIIKNKFTKKPSLTTITIPSLLRNKINVLSSYILDTRPSLKDIHQLQVDIKSCSSELTEAQLNTLRESNLFLGLTGVIFVVPSFDHHNMFWLSTRTRLYQILQSKPCIPGLPLAIINTTNSDLLPRDIIETKLDLHKLKKEGLISQWVIFENSTVLDTDEFHRQMADVFRWLFENTPRCVGIKSRSLKNLVEDEVYKCFTVPFYEEMKLRTRTLLPPQCPEVIIDLYNAVIQHLASVITNEKLQKVSVPAPEFLRDKESVPWNSPTTFEYLRSTMSCIMLPQSPQAARDGLWETECSLCIEYITKLTNQRHLKQFQFPLINRVSKMLQSKEASASTSLTAAEVPWPDVVHTCINMVLSWLHSSVNDQPAWNIMYFEDDLQSFIAPLSWRTAVMETTKLAHVIKSEKKAKRKAPDLDDLDFDVDKFLTSSCLELSQQRGNDAKNASLTDDIKNKTDYLDEELFMEKRDSQRFEEQLKLMLLDDISVEQSVVAQTRTGKCEGPWLKENTTSRLNDSSFRYFQTTVVSLQDQIRLQKHIEELSELQLEEALKSSP